MNFHEFCWLQLCKYRRLFPKKINNPNYDVPMVIIQSWLHFKSMFHYFLLSHEGEIIHTFVIHVDILEKLVLGFSRLFNDETNLGLQ
jgi:hypothetical protein